jgi:EAL domain-containing protein (putative c-di-GMP-specific phosphodiesterase class I)
VNNNARIEGAEVLVRWVLPDGTIKEPAEFLGILEKTDFITHMDYYVWEQSVKLLHKWDGSRFGHLFLSINVSPRDFYYIDVEQVLTELLEKHQVPKERLRIEVTVNALATDLSRQMFYINRLKAAGFTVEIDDFTKNMSAVGVLMDTKADTLKFNLRYFRDAMDNSRSRQMTLSFIEMSKKLGMKVAIEGIETEKQFEEAKLLGSDTLQGYYFSKPIPVEQFEANL